MVKKNGHIRIDLDDCVNLIRDTHIREFVQAALNETDPKFFDVPSSRSGAYHAPPCNISPGGLAVHIRKTVQVALLMIRFYQEGHSNIDFDEIVAACILHDICKGGLPGQWGESTNYEHGPIGAQWLQELYFKIYGKDNARITRICDLVYCHMGRFNKPNPTPAPMGDLGHHIVQVGDYIGSMRELDYICNEILDLS